jgi:hypothetical protein
MLTDLDNLEESILKFSVRRYRRPFYRWGHLLGWLTFPLLALAFLPASKPYEVWIVCAVNLCIFSWYSVVITRVIGKLAARLGMEAAQSLDANHGQDHPTPHAANLLVVLAALPIAALVAFRASEKPLRAGHFLIEIWASEMALCIFVSLAAMVASYVVYFAGNQLLANRLMAFAMRLIAWVFVALVAYGVIEGFTGM